uniref:beta-glucosidase n=1 Tax=Blastobotrys adeninivorans TaxID=409370 RepID=A0A060T8W5_BLAAD
MHPTWLLVPALAAAKTIFPPNYFNSPSEAEVAKSPLTNVTSPHVYPGIHGGRVIDDDWADAYERAREFVSQLTLAEKINLTSSTGWEMGPCVGNTGDVPRLEMNGLCLQDGPLGVRLTELISAFPAGITVGATFNKTLMKERGAAIGAEHRGKGVDVALGPAVGPLGVKAAGGRIWEAFGADPYLQGIAGAEYVEGLQSQNVMACGKHFIANEQEVNRNYISSNVGDRAMHELYAWPFADMIHAGVGSIMCSYNKVNHTYSCENSYMLNHLLKDEMGFQGFVMSDWGALHSGVGSVLAGTDMEMPAGGMTMESGFDIPKGMAYFGANLTIAVLNETVPLDRVDDMATRIMAAFYYVGVDKAREERNGEGPNFSSWTLDSYAPQYALTGEGPIVEVNKHVDVRTETSRRVARQVAQEGIVLLKNKNNTLPLGGSSCALGKLVNSTVNGPSKFPRKIGILGLAAGPDSMGPVCGADLGCSGGALAGGWGSGQVNLPYQITPFEAINRRAIDKGAAVQYHFASYNYTNFDVQASHNDVNIVFGLTDSGEGYIYVDENYGDRKNYTLWHNAEETILKAANYSNNTIAVISSPGPANLEKFINHPNITAVLFTTPGGQDAGEAIADVLFGDVNPSGRLPFTIAKDDNEYIPIVTKGLEDNFDEDLYVDYRWYDKFNVTPRFEFGYGLSYSKFTFSNLKIDIGSPSELLSAPPALGEALSYNDKVPDASELLFPDDIEPVNAYLYPYIDSTDEADANDDFTYPPNYSDKQPASASPAGGGPGGNPGLWEKVGTVSASLSNVGPYPGAYVAQLYIGYPEDSKLPTPPKQLRGFDKVHITPGSSSKVTFDLLWRDLSVWDSSIQSWRVPRGTYKVYVGSSSRNLELVDTFSV